MLIDGVNKIKVNEVEYDKTIEELKKDPPVVLVGSFISTWLPTSLPNAQKLTSDIFELLFPQTLTGLDEIGNRYLRTIFTNVPFEHVFERCSNEEKIRKIIKEAFLVDAYNPAHQAIADGLISGKFRAVITTNYDLCFDKLFGYCSTQSNRQIKRIIRESDYTNHYPTNNRFYFKIHGSADDVDGESLVFALRHESILPDWKRKLLIEALSGKNLLVIGYSGLDFEICPELSNIPIKQIYWNSFTDKFPSPNAEILLRKNSNNVLLIGDMRNLLSDLIWPISAQAGISSDNFIFEIYNKFTQYELNYWRVTLLNSMGCPSIAFNIAQSCLGDVADDKLDFLRMNRQIAQALFHKGRYRDSANTFLLSAKLANQLSDTLLEAELLLDTCDAFRCYGAFYRSSKVLNRALNLCNSVSHEFNKNRLLGKFHLKRILLMRHLYQISKYISWLRSWIIKKCTQDLKAASKFALQTGNWLEFQQTRWWAERLGIDPAILADKEYYQAPPSKSGYDHLGYHVAQCGVFRDMLQKTKDRLSDQNKTLLINHLEHCKLFGNIPEIWKLLFLKLKRDKEDYGNTFYGFLKHFFKCQYRPLIRIQQLLTGG